MDVPLGLNLLTTNLPNRNVRPNDFDAEIPSGFQLILKGAGRRERDEGSGTKGAGREREGSGKGAGRERDSLIRATSFQASGNADQPVPLRRPCHVDTGRQRLASNVHPVLGARPIPEIEVAEFVAAVKAIEKRALRFGCTGVIYKPLDSGNPSKGSRFAH